MIWPSPVSNISPFISAEYSHVLKEVSATYATNEGNTPLVLTTISAETCPGLTEEHKSLLNGNKDLGNADGVPNVSVELVMQKKVTDPGVLQMDKIIIKDINSNNTAVKTCEDKTCMIIKDTQYDDISEQENKSECLSSNEDLCIQNFAIDMPPTAKVPESTGDARFGLDQVQSKSTSHKDLTDGDSGAVFASKYELDSLLTDTDDDDEWEVVPLSIFRLTFEETDDRACEGKTNRSCSAQKTTSAFSQMEVFDTPAEQELAVKFGQVSFVVPSYSSNRERMSQILRRRKELCSEPEDSCDTDNSSDYSSDSESNNLTVPKQSVQNVSSSLQVNIVKSEKKNQGNKAKKWQKSSIQEAIINLDSDDESDEDCVKKTESSERCHPHSENSWTNAANEHKIPYLQPLKGSTVYPSTGYHQGESSQISRGTENGLCVINEVSSQKISNNIIIIVSDSDDDSMEMFNIRPHSEPVDLTDKENLKDPKQSSAEQSESNSKSNWDKDVSNRPIIPGKTSFYESSTEKKDLTKKRILSSERVDSDNLNNAGNGLCTKRKKVITSEAGSSMDLGPVIPRLLVQLSPHSSEHIQLVHESGSESRDKDLFTPNSFREKTVNGFGGNFSKVHNTPRLKLNRASFGLKKGAPSPKQLLHNLPLPYAPDPLKKGLLSVDRTIHARNKVFNDWQRNHVPLRKERKATKRKNYRRRTL